LLVLAATEDAEGEFLAEDVLADDEASRLCVGGNDPEEEYLPFPAPFPPRTSRNAWAPKDTRLANGDAWLLGGIFSESSTASS
jgi:hypothetical protein